MEFVDGQTLADRIAACGQLPASEALFILQAAAEALNYMHSHGIVHRDIKSNNIKITSQGAIKLLDFGIAKDNSTPAFTQAGDVIGTLQYLSPELLKGEPADARSDIWALGVLLYEMVTSRTPFEASTIGQLYEKISKSSFTQATMVNPGLPREIDGLISRCLKRSPADRYQSIPDLLAETTRLASLVSTPRLSTTAREKGSAGLSKSRLGLISAAAALLLILLVVVIFSLIGGPSEETVANRNASENDSGQTRTVTIDVSEGHADVYRGGEKLGMTPFRFEGKPGEELQLLLKADGYVDKTVRLSVGKQDKPYTFRLDKK
jgi:serine/threonine protein kinase